MWYFDESEYRCGPRVQRFQDLPIRQIDPPDVPDVRWCVNCGGEQPFDEHGMCDYCGEQIEFDSDLIVEQGE